MMESNNNKPLIRIIDDDAGVRSSWSFLLSGENYECVEFSDADTFFSANDFRRPGCILLDVRMPNMSGLELQNKLKEIGCDLPIVFVSGHADIDMAVNAVKNGAEIAIDEINALGGQQYEMKFEDDENDAEKAINAYNSLKDWGMQILMGTVTSNPCIAVAAETANDNMFQLTPSGSAEGCIANDNAFRVCFSDPEQGTLSADYIVENSLAAKVAVIYDSSDPYSSGIHDAFVTEAQEKGLEIVSDEAFTADSNKDFTVQIQKAQSAGAELVFLPIYYTEASLILTQADKIGYEPVFFGCDGLDGLVSVENFDTSLAEDVMLMTPFTASATDDKTAAFVKAYNEAYGEDPNPFAADAYDAIYAIHAAVEKAGVTADMDASAICDALKAAFTEITLEGLTGKGITWDASGAPAKSPLVYIIKDGVYTAA